MFKRIFCFVCLITSVASINAMEKNCSNVYSYKKEKLNFSISYIEKEKLIIAMLGYKLKKRDFGYCFIKVTKNLKTGFVDVVAEEINDKGLVFKVKADGFLVEITKKRIVLCEESWI